MSKLHVVVKSIALESDVLGNGGISNDIATICIKAYLMMYEAWQT